MSFWKDALKPGVRRPYLNYCTTKGQSTFKKIRTNWIRWVKELLFQGLSWGSGIVLADSGGIRYPVLKQMESRRGFEIISRGELLELDKMLNLVLLCLPRKFPGYNAARQGKVLPNLSAVMKKYPLNPCPKCVSFGARCNVDRFCSTMGLFSGDSAHGITIQDCNTLTCQTHFDCMPCRGFQPAHAQCTAEMTAKHAQCTMN